MSVYTFLKSCRDRIDTPDKWVRGTEMKKRNGQEMFCLIGAIKEEDKFDRNNLTGRGGSYSYGFGRHSKTGLCAIKILADVIRKETNKETDLFDQTIIVEFNDGNHSLKKDKHKTVMSVLDKAIDKAKERNA